MAFSRVTTRGNQSRDGVRQHRSEVKRAVEISAGVSIARGSHRLEVNSGTLKADAFIQRTIRPPTGIIIRKGRTLNLAARHLIEMLRTRAK
jgi:hypothetical protein